MKVSQRDILPTGAFLAVETANTYQKVVQKMAFKDFHGMLPFALHGYRTSVHASTGA